MEGIANNKKQILPTSEYVNNILVENISSMFLLPCLKIKEEIKSKFNQFGFINTYMFWDKHCDYGEYIPLYILFKPDVYDLGFYKFSQALERNQNHIETIDNSDGSVVFVFRIPRRFEKDYKLFKKGYYSKFSPEFIECFPLKTYRVGKDNKPIKDEKGRYITDYTLFYHVIYRTNYMAELLRETYGDSIELPEEFYEIYREDRETLNL